MDIKERALLLENAIKLGNFAEVRKLVGDITNVDVIRRIEKEFCDKDPLVCAIEYREQEIALFLVEKGFNHRLIYNYPGRHCDQWCYVEHGEDRCPTEFDAFDLAEAKRLNKVHRVIKDIRSGRRMPGDGLALMQNPEFKREDSSMSNKVRSMSAADGQSNTLGTFARRRIKEFGVTYLSRTGDSIIHVCDTPAMVYVCANMGVNINAANFNGDSALHLAVRKGQRDVCQALLMNGADPNQRNKLGQTPLDETSELTKPILEKFKPGLVQVANRGEFNSLQRLIRLWCNPHSKISRDGKSAIEIMENNCKMSNNHSKAYNIMMASCKTLELTHAVLSEDIQTMKRILRTESGWTLNKRFKDSIGQTMVSCAIEQNNLEIVQLLVESGKCNLNMRVREHDEVECRDTVPILFKTLEEGCTEEIWSYVDYNVDCFQASEKDVLGNTAILRAIMKGRSRHFIKRMMKRHAYNCLTERNRDGLSIKELASELKRTDIVQLVDDFIIATASSLHLIQLPTEFYGLENLPTHEKIEALMPETKYKAIEEKGVAVHEAAAKGDAMAVAKLNDAVYKDKNGYTALTRAIVGGHLKVAEILITERPVLKSIADNCNRYPLHYAYALPQGHLFVKLLLQRNPEDIENKMDKYGLEPAEYQDRRHTDEVQEMLRDVLTLDPYGKRQTLERGIKTPPETQQYEQQMYSTGRES